ncbi:Nucleoside diphosphate-linked moiety X motif 13 [Varanus komodoensis]|nr:Nucleoside diphosphate-linked moiety X motif 13 [Varanus komodoensis]
MVIAFLCRIGYRRTSSLYDRFHSTYVKRMRYMFQLKEDDNACREAYNSGDFFLFHNFCPFVQQKGKTFWTPKINTAGKIKRLFGKYRESEERIEDSIVIGCSEECTPYFALDLGSLERSAIESELNGTFTKLQKAFFQLEKEDAALISTSSVLSPILFNLYMKLLRAVIRRSGPRSQQYADDPQLFLSFTFNPFEVVSVLNLGLSSVMDWMKVNKLKLNPEKMEVLLVDGLSDWLEGHYPALEGVALPLKDRVHSMGVLLDPGLPPEAQVDLAARAPSFSCGDYINLAPTWIDRAWPQAQALLHWHEDNQYCRKTGQPTTKNLAGSKRVCHNSGIIYYPQMSPVVITLVSDGSRCLLIRQASFPKGMYSALSGFCDVGESVEETVRREVAEEVGLEVESLWYSASQHWPFPNSSLMIACHALVHPERSKISINRQELEAAKWFSLEEVVEALGREPKLSKGKDESLSFWVPPKQAIAHQLLQEWVKEQVSGPA